MSARSKMLTRVSRTGRFAAVGALVLGGIAVIPGSASAGTATEMLFCRPSPASEPGGVQVTACMGISNDSVSAVMRVSVDLGGVSAYPCAQLWQANWDGTESFVYDFGCLGVWVGPRGYAGGSGSRGDLALSALPTSPGEYVVRVGYWATINGQYGYYGDVESPVGGCC